MPFLFGHLLLILAKHSGKIYSLHLSVRYGQRERKGATNKKQDVDKAPPVFAGSLTRKTESALCLKLKVLQPTANMLL